MALWAVSFLKFAAVASWPGWGRSAWILGSNAAFEPISASSDIAPVTSARRVSRPASRIASAPSAAMRWVPLRSARPSLVSRTSGRRPARASAWAAGI